MPRQVTLDDGSQLEVPTDEEMAGYKTQATTIETLTKEKSDLEAANKAYEADPSNKNWQLVRNANDKMKAALKAQGKEVDDNGNVSEAQKQMTVEEIRAEATKAAQETFVNNYKESKLKALPEEKKKVVEHFFSKLSANEVLTVEKVDSYLGSAMILAEPPKNSGAPHVNGLPPQIGPQNGAAPKYSETEEAKDIANQMFGKDSFAQPPAK